MVSLFSGLNQLEDLTLDARFATVCGYTQADLETTFGAHLQGVDWDQLKKGVGQLVNAAQPGQEGNLVLAAHNDIFGEIFRHLDKLSPGDEIIISTERRTYTYVVREIKVVEPTAVSVMDPTAHAQTTLISCYPYQINTQRIVVFAALIPNANSPTNG